MAMPELKVVTLNALHSILAFRTNAAETGSKTDLNNAMELQASELINLARLNVLS